MFTPSKTRKRKHWFLQSLFKPHKISAIQQGQEEYVNKIAHFSII